MQFFFSCFLCLFIHFSAQSQRASNHPLQEKNLADIAARWLHTPYLLQSLEHGNDSMLINRTDGFDCFTLVESTLAQFLAENLHSHCEEILPLLRYRDGCMHGYGARIHYFWEWLLQAESNAFLTEVTPLSESTLIRKPVSYISNHPAAYPGSKHQSDFQQIRAAEIMLSNQQLRYLATKSIKKNISLIHPGDIIGFVSDKPTLDFVHTGIAATGPKGIHLLHASKTARRVILSLQTIDEYAASHQGITGISIWRSRPKSR